MCESAKESGEKPEETALYDNGRRAANMRVFRGLPPRMQDEVLSFAIDLARKQGRSHLELEACLFH